MGCDIHLYREKKIDGEWLTADVGWEAEQGELSLPYEKQIYTGRNYNLFGLLCGVRRPNQYSKNLKGCQITSALRLHVSTQNGKITDVTRQVI